MESEYNANDADIAKEAFELLTSPEHQGRAILLSYLGGRLSRKFSPWRKLLAGRSLRNVLEAELGTQISFEGTGSQVSVALATEGGVARTPRFDKTIWAAFAKPIHSGFRRILYTNRPFSFDDEPSDAEFTIKAGGYEVETHLIPDENVPRFERDRTIYENIRQWCLLKEVEISNLFEANDTVSPVRSRPSATVAMPGLVALEQLITAIPSGERKNFSLPLDLLHRLISSN